MIGKKLKRLKCRSPQHKRNGGNTKSFLGWICETPFSFLFTQVKLCINKKKKQGKTPAYIKKIPVEYCLHAYFFIYHILNLRFQFDAFLLNGISFLNNMINKRFIVIRSCIDSYIHECSHHGSLCTGSTHSGI